LKTNLHCHMKIINVSPSKNYQLCTCISGFRRLLKTLFSTAELPDLTKRLCSLIFFEIGFYGTLQILLILLLIILLILIVASQCYRTLIKHE
jgi:hypothetical protein